MNEIAIEDYKRSYSSFIRLGGLSGLLAVVIHIVVNMVIKVFPPEGPTLEELRAYLIEQSGNWAIVHGLRYVAFVALALLVAAIYTRTCRSTSIRDIGWGIFGLLGATMLLANVMITNGIETFAFLDFTLLSEQKELFNLLFYTTRVLFTAEIVSWAVVIFGFSMAGWHSNTLPLWLVTPGLVLALAGVLSNIFIVSVLNEGWASIFLTVAGLGGPVWFVSVSIYMLAKGAK